MLMSVSSGRGTHASMQNSQRSAPLHINLPHRERKEVNTAEFVRNVNVELYCELDEERQEEYVEDIDAIELFDTLKELEQELARTKLEIHYLTDFLEQNNPKLLIGLKQRRSTLATTARKSVGNSLSTQISMSTGLATGMDSSRRSMTGTAAMSLGQGGNRRMVTEYRLSYRTKAEMAEKSVIDVEKRLKQIEKKARQEIRHLRAKVEELGYRGDETEETAKSFMLHFMADHSDLAFLESATEKQLIHKLLMFTSNWLKNGRGLMATMRLRHNHLQESCQQYRSELITKSDLSKVLSSIDFEQIMIKRTQLLQDLDDKYVHMTGIKSKTGKSSMSMGEEKASMTKMEKKHKDITNKIIEVGKAIEKLEQECESLEASNESELKELEQLQTQQQRYHAPSVSSYFERKHELWVLEKEEKMLKRKINIMSMKLANLQHKRYKLGQ